MASLIAGVTSIAYFGIRVKECSRNQENLRVEKINHSATFCKFTKNTKIQNPPVYVNVGKHGSLSLPIDGGFRKETKTISEYFWTSKKPTKTENIELCVRYDSSTEKTKIYDIEHFKQLTQDLQIASSDQAKLKSKLPIYLNRIDVQHYFLVKMENGKFLIGNSKERLVSEYSWLNDAPAIGSLIFGILMIMLFCFLCLIDS